MEEVTTLRKELADAQEQKAEADKEQEDVRCFLALASPSRAHSISQQLLVLLEDVSSKRKGDKARMRAQGLEVSEDEEEDEEEEEEQGEGLV